MVDLYNILRHITSTKRNEEPGRELGEWQMNSQETMRHKVVDATQEITLAITMMICTCS